MSRWHCGILVPASFIFSSFLCVAHAQSVTGTVDVSIELTGGCEVNDSTDTTGVDFGSLEFGTHSTLFVQADAAVLNGGTEIEVLCSPGISPSFQITGGSNDANGGSANHAMVNDGNYVPYSIYTDAGRNDVLAVNTPYSLSGTADGVTPQTLELYGRAFGAPGLQSGTYTDTLSVELSF